MPANYIRVILPNDVLRAIEHIVAWAHSDEDLADSVLQYDVPALEDWLVAIGRLPPEAIKRL
jgi:hypothetical protein